MNGPIVGGAVAPDGRGYWLVARDGGIFTFGSARFYGSMGAAHLNQPVFSMAPTNTGRGYWLVARDGGIFSFGDARFHGSTGNFTLQQPINGITTSPTGQGYRMVARDGGIFSFGDAAFYGSVPGLGLNVDDVVGMAPTPSNRGYWIARAGGELYDFGDARAFNDYAATGVRSRSSGSSRTRRRRASGSCCARGRRSRSARRPAVATPPARSCSARRVPDVVVITLDEYERITVSMSYADVVYIVGGPGRLTEDYKVARPRPRVLHVARCRAARPRLIEFRDYHVASKAQVALNPPTMSLGEYLGVSVGMSYDQVAFLVGGPGTLVAASNVGGYEHDALSLERRRRPRARALREQPGGREVGGRAPVTAARPALGTPLQYWRPHG